MLTITNYTVEKLEDPFGILSGDRYEFFIHVDVPEDDELYSEKGLYIKVLYLIEENKSRILQYYITEKQTEAILDFELDEDELNTIEEYCEQHLPNE